MIRRNLLGLDTRRGYCTCELLEGDITDLDGPIDLLLVSAFAGSYLPTPGTVLGAMRSRWGVDARALGAAPEYDLRQSLSVWIARLKETPFDRMMCLELSGAPKPPPRVIQNAFAAITLLEATGVRVRTVAMPVLGAGLQQIPVRSIVHALLAATRNLTQRSDTLERVIFVELDPSRALALSEALDTVLGRSRVVLPKSELLGTLRQDVASQLTTCAPLFAATQSTLHEELSRLVAQPEIRSFELGVLARRLAEYMSVDIGASPNEQLSKRIRLLETTGTIAPWICGYLHLLRHFGNEAAHEQPAVTRFPPVVQEDDLTMALFCVSRLLSVWPDCRAIAKATT